MKTKPRFPEHELSNFRIAKGKLDAAYARCKTVAAQNRVSGSRLVGRLRRNAMILADAIDTYEQANRKEGVSP